MLSQYANSPTYVKLIEGIRESLDNSQTIQDFMNVVFNLKTAKGYGLDIWGNILNTDRYLTFQGNNIYLRGELDIGGVHYSSDEVEELYRQMLFVKAMSNITNCTIASLNHILNYYFEGRGSCYVYEVDTMELRCVFRFYLNAVEKAIFDEVFPHPTGTEMSFEYLPDKEYFGMFVEGDTQEQQPYAPFDNKPFYR